MLFAEYLTPETVVAFQSWGGVIITFAAVIGVGFAGIRWVSRIFDKRIAAIAQQLDARTEPIQSGYLNGGNSLTDISKRLLVMQENQGRLTKEIGDLRQANLYGQELVIARIERISEDLAKHSEEPKAHGRRSTDY